MRVIVVYKENYDHTRTVTDFLRDLNRQTGQDLEVINPDTVEGVQFCKDYGIMQYPTIVAVSDDGVMQHMWTGLPLPMINEVSFYSRQR